MELSLSRNFSFQYGINRHNGQEVKGAHSNPEPVKLNTMSDHNGLSLEEYLAAKTETQLRNYLFKMKGGVARLCQHHFNISLLKLMLQVPR